MAQSVVTKALQDNLVMVFSKTYCPHCLRAKRVLDAELGKSKYVVMELENRSDCAAIQDYLRQLTGARTVPRVFLQWSFPRHIALIAFAPSGSSTLTLAAASML